MPTCRSVRQVEMKSMCACPHDEKRLPEKNVLLLNLRTRVMDVIYILFRTYRVHTRTQILNYPRAGCHICPRSNVLITHLKMRTIATVVYFNSNVSFVMEAQSTGPQYTFTKMFSPGRPHLVNNLI